MKASSDRRFDLIMFDWNGTLSTGVLAPEQHEAGRVTALFPGVKALLETLKSRGIHLGIATAASRFDMAIELLAHGLDGTFDCVYTLTDGPPKPDPFALLEAMHQLGVSPERTLMVGDSCRDMEMAKRAGVLAVAVGYGLHGEADLRAAGAEEVFSNLSELLTRI